MYSPSQLLAYYREHFVTQGFPALFMGKTFAVHISIFFLGSTYFFYFNMRHPGLADSRTDCEMGNDSGKRRLRVRDKRPYLVLLLSLGFISKHFD